MILLLLRVCDSLSQTQSQCFSIGTILLKPLVVFIEVVNFLNGFELFLKIVLGLNVKAAEVIVEVTADLHVVLFELVLNDLAQSVEDHRDVETSQSSFKAHFVS